MPTPAQKPSPSSKPKPLTEDELTYLRDFIEERKRARWVWTTIRTYALWITGVCAGVGVGFDSLKKLVLFLVQR